MGQFTNSFNEFFKLCKRYNCIVIDCVVHEGAIVNNSFTVAYWDRKKPYMYGNRVKVNADLVRQGRMEEIESLLIGCVMEDMFK